MSSPPDSDGFGVKALDRGFFFELDAALSGVYRVGALKTAKAVAEDGQNNRHEENGEFSLL